MFPVEKKTKTVTEADDDDEEEDDEEVETRAALADGEQAADKPEEAADDDESGEEDEEEDKSGEEDDEEEDQPELPSGLTGKEELAICLTHGWEMIRLYKNQFHYLLLLTISFFIRWYRQGLFIDFYFVVIVCIKI